MKAPPGQARIVVLGGTSHVWRAMAPYWQREAPDIEAVVWARRPAPGIDVVSPLAEAASRLPPCYVVLAMWGVTSGPRPALDANIRLARAAQEIGRRLGAGAVFHAMTGAVYAPSGEALAETADLAPRHDYGASKLAAEQALAEATPRPIRLRLGNVAGTDALADGMAEAARARTPVRLDRFSDGTTPRRAFIAPDDLARAVSHLVRRAEDLPWSVFNLAGPTPVEMAALVAHAGVCFEYRPAPASALPVQHLDTSRLAALGLDLARSADPAHLAGFLPATDPVGMASA